MESDPPLGCRARLRYGAKLSCVVAIRLTSRQVAALEAQQERLSRLAGIRIGRSETLRRLLGSRALGPSSGASATGPAAPTPARREPGPSGR
jgi:hypothetical protein